VTLGPFVCIRTTWSDDAITVSEPLPEWFAGWVLLTYGDRDFWRGQTRPVRAIFTDRHLFDPDAPQSKRLN
jgi:hypothetical protein